MSALSALALSIRSTKTQKGTPSDICSLIANCLCCDRKLQLHQLIGPLIILSRYLISSTFFLDRTMVSFVEGLIVDVTGMEAAFSRKKYFKTTICL
jgi:hypothetical protein